MTWSKEWPKEEGFYWVIVPIGEPLIGIGRVMIAPTMKWVDVVGWWRDFTEEEDRMFFGPRVDPPPAPTFVMELAPPDERQNRKAER